MHDCGVQLRLNITTYHYNTVYVYTGQNQKQELEDLTHQLEGVLASQSNITKHIVNTLQQNCESYS